MNKQTKKLPRKRVSRAAIILALALFSVALPGRLVRADPLPAAGMQAAAFSVVPDGGVRGALAGPAALPTGLVIALYAGILLLAIGIEIFIAFLLIRFIFEIVLFPPWKIILSVSAVNLLAVPGSVFLPELLTQSAIIPHLYAVLLTEVLIVVVEALWYRRAMSLNSGNALLLSLIINTATYLFRVILFGF